MAFLRQVEHEHPLQVIRASARATRSILGTDVTLKIYGDSPLRERLTRKVVESGLADRIELMGRVEHTELAQVFIHADIYLQTPPAESFGISTLGARSAGLVVVVMRSSRARDFITDGADGPLADDDADLGCKLTTLLGGDELLERIKIHNYEVAPLAEWGTVVQMNVETYRRATAPVGA